MCMHRRSILALILFLMVLPSIADAVSSASAPTGLVGHWTFDNKDMISTVADVSGRGNNGRLMNFTSTTTVAGVLGQALDFDAAHQQYVSIQNSPSLRDYPNGVTYSVWFKLKSAEMSGVLAQTGSPYLDLWMNGESKLRWETNDGQSFLSPRNILPNVWYHAVGTYDTALSSNQAKLYINGILDNQATLSFTTTNTHPVVIGLYYGWGSINGAIDDARIYNRALSGAEVTQLYNSGITSTSTIQGYRVLMPGNVADTVAQTVRVSGGASSATNPYYLAVKSGSTYTVSVPARTNYSVGYTLCIDSTTCHSQTPTAGRIAAVTIPSGGRHYADLWWHYKPILTAKPNPCTVTVGSTTCSTALAWGKPSTPVSQLWVSVNGAAQTKVTCKSGLMQKIPWIRPNRSYAFKLYHTDSCTTSVTNVAPNARVTVRGNIATTTVVGLFTHTLARTWTGPEVIALQTALGQLGFYSGEVTGYFGPVTEAAVKSLQVQNNIAAVGILGPLTRSLLQRLLGY